MATTSFKKLFKFSFWIRKALGMFPQSIRYSIFRNLISLNYAPDKNFEFKVAESQEELEAAFSILHDAYVGSGFMQKHKSGMRVTPYHALPSTSTLIGKYNGKVIATVSIVRKSSFGFPLEKIFDISEFESRGTRLAEISALAIHRDFRGNKGDVLWLLLKFMYEYCTKYFGIDYITVAVNPSRIDFYKGLLFFDLLDNGEVHKYDFVKGVEAVGGILDLRRAYSMFASKYLHKMPEKNLFKYFTETSFDIFKFPDRKFFKISDPVMTPKNLNYFFREKTDVFAELKTEELNRIASQFPLAEYNFALQCKKEDVERMIRIERRFDVQCKGELTIPNSDLFVTMDVLDVSLSGFSALLERPVRFGFCYYINIAVGTLKVAEVRAQPVWRASDNVFGFSIEDSSSSWLAFSANLHKLHNGAESANTSR